MSSTKQYPSFKVGDSIPFNVNKAEPKDSNFILNPRKSKETFGFDSKVHTDNANSMMNTFDGSFGGHA